MSALQRLLVDPNASALEREILNAWHQEQPKQAGKERMLAGLGIASVSAPIAATVGGSIAPKAMATVGWFVWGKWVALSVVALALVGGAATVLGSHHAASAPTPVLMAPTAPLTIANDPPMTAPALPLVVSPAARPLLAMNKQAQITAPQASTTSLTEQVAALDHARAVLDAGDPAQAIALVDAYETRFPNGAFVQEADVLRVDALEKKGDHTKAIAAGKHFLQTYPKSPHTTRVRALLNL